MSNIQSGWKGLQIMSEYARISPDVRENIRGLPHNAISRQWQGSPSCAASKRPTAKLSASVRLPRYRQVSDVIN